MGDDAATVEQLRAELRQLRELRAADQAEIAALRHREDRLVGDLLEARQQQAAHVEAARPEGEAAAGAPPRAAGAV
jgi:predicted  nucleic acid-binding Zn-ribbon protein